MADIQHKLLSQNDTAGGKGIHPQLSIPDFANEAARLAYSQAAADRGRLAWQTSDGTTWQADGAGEWRQFGGAAAAVDGAGAGYRRIVAPAPVPLSAWDFNGDGLDVLGVRDLVIASGAPGYRVTSGDSDNGDFLLDPPNATIGDRVAHAFVNHRWQGGYNGGAGGDATWLPLALTGALTIMAWIRPDAFSDYDYLAVWGTAAGTPEAKNTLYSFGIRTVGGLPQFQYDHTNGAGPLEEFTGAGSPMKLNVWQHIAMTRAANGVDLKFYKNGRLHETHSMASPPTGGGEGWFSVGEHPNGFNEFYGLMAGLAIYNAELTHAQVYEDFQRVRRGTINKA